MGYRSRSAFGQPGFALGLLVAAVSSGDALSAEPTAAAQSPETFEVPAGDGVISEFLGCELEDGTDWRAPVGAKDMPWRVAIGMPRHTPRYGSRADGRAAAIGAMRQWERAIQTELPWFRLEFVEKDSDAAVQIRWKRRMTGGAVGRAGPTCARHDDGIVAGGRMELSVRHCPTCRQLTIDEISMLIAHEFGHVLGLGHCLDCDSAMNYSWETRDRVFVTQTDVDAIVRRFREAKTRAE